MFVARQQKRCEQAEKNLLEATQDKAKQDQLLATAQVELEKFEEQLKKDLNGSSADVAMNGEEVLIPMDETDFLSPDEHAKQLNEITTEFIKRKAAQGDTPEQKQMLERQYHVEIGRLHKTIAFRGMNRSFWILSILLFQITSASGAAIGSPPVMTSGARLQSVRNESAVIAAATVAAAAATNATVYKGEEGRKFTTAERQALGCQCVASCYHFREYNPWPYRFPAKKCASGEEGIKVVSWNVNTLRRVVSSSFLESTEVWDVVMLQDTKHWSHDHLRWMGDSITPFTNSNRNQPTFRHMPPHSFGLVTLVRSTTKAVMKESGPRYLVVEITCPGGRVALVNLYAPLWLRHVTPRQLDRMRAAARKAGEGDVAYSDRCSKETAMVAEFDDFVENLTAIQARAESQRMPILYAGDYNSDLCAGMPWWMTKVLQNGWGSMMEPAAESIQHTYRSPQTVGMEGDGGTSRIDGFCVPEAIAPLLRYPEMQIAEPTDNAYYDHVPIRCELLMGNIQPIRQMRDQFRYPTKYLDKEAISPQLYEAITRALVSVLASKESTNEDMLTRIGELAQLIERPACEQRRRRDPPDRDKKHLRQLLSQAIRAGAREIVPLVRKLIQQHDKIRAAERLANLKSETLTNLRQLRPRFMPWFVVSTKKIPRYQHFSILLVTWSRARHQLRKSSCTSGEQKCLIFRRQQPHLNFVRHFFNHLQSKHRTQRN